MILFIFNNNNIISINIESVGLQILEQKEEKRKEIQ